MAAFDFPTSPTLGQVANGYTWDGEKWLLTDAANPVLSALRGYLSGLTLSTAGSSATFGVAAGVACNSTAVAMMTLATAYTKTTSSWTLGTAGGALDTGGIANNAWYHVHLIRRPDTGVVDICISQSATTPTVGGAIPAAYTQFRRIGSMRTNGSAQWTKFTQDGDEFLWDTGVADVTAAASSNAAASLTLSVPVGVKVSAYFSARIDYSSGVVGFIFSSLDQADIAPSGAIMGIIASPTHTSPVTTMYVRTNTSGQIRIRPNGAGCTYNVFTQGWTDTRGRDA